MKRLSKKTREERDRLMGEIEAASNALNDAISQFESFREDVRGDMESYASERSDRWRESDAGSAYDDWMAEWDEEVCDEAQPRELEYYPESPDE